MSRSYPRPVGGSPCHDHDDRPWITRTPYKLVPRTNWSRIAEGGVYSAARVAEGVGHGAAVVFVTDGQEAPPVLPSRALMRDINPAGIKGWLIGVGGDQPAAIPKSDADGNRIGYWQADDVIQVPTTPGSDAPAETHEELSELRGQYLGFVAGQTGLGYRPLWTTTSLGDAMLDARFAHREPVPTDLRWCPALLALLLFVGRFAPDAIWEWRDFCRRQVRRAVRWLAPAGGGVSVRKVGRVNANLQRKTNMTGEQRCPAAVMATPSSCICRLRNKCMPSMFATMIRAPRAALARQSP
jgi:hypothetical protein